jgi:hypothetical protein
MTPLTWWGSVRTVGTGDDRTVVSVIMQGREVIQVLAADAPAMEIRRLAGLVDG